MREGGGKPIRLEGLLNPQHQIPFNGPNVRRHVESSACHQQTVNLVKGVFCVIDGKDDQNVNPITSKKVNKRWK